MADEETKEEKKFSLKILVILLVAIIAGGGGYFVYTKYFSAKTGPEKVAQAAEKGKAEESKPGADNEMGPIYKMAPFIVNLADADGRRYLKTTIELEMADDNVRAEVDKRLPMLRDAMLILLSGKTFEEINDTQGKMTLRQEMESKFDSLISTGAIKRVYFTEFVVQ